MKWKRDKNYRNKDIFWTSDVNYIIRRGVDNDAELVVNGVPVFRGTQDECKQHAETLT